MASEVILCTGCGNTLRPFMRLCPQCGAPRINSAPPAEPLPEGPSIKLPTPRRQPPAKSQNSPTLRPEPPSPPPRGETPVKPKNGATHRPEPPPFRREVPMKPQNEAPIRPQPSPPRPEARAEVPPQKRSGPQPELRAIPEPPSAKETAARSDNGRTEETRWIDDADHKAIDADLFDDAPDVQTDGQEIDQKTEVIPFDLVRVQKNANHENGNEEELFPPVHDLVFLSPNEPQPRFPALTPARRKVLAIVAGILFLILLIGYLLWRREEAEQLQKLSTNIGALPHAPAPVPTLPPAPSPSPLGDVAITESVSAALQAYSSRVATQYKIDVKDGAVTISGESDHQTEKDGVESVVRFVAGVRSVVNNIQVKPAPPILGPTLNPGPIRLNPVEAKILDDAMQKQMQLSEQLANREPAAPAPNAAAREVRDQAAARFREEDAAARRLGEERIRRDAENYERRQEELRRIEAERRSRAEQARLEASTLSSGTIAWSGLVDGAEEIILTGSSASVRHLNGPPPRDVKASFSAPLPRSPAKITLLSVAGRGSIKVAQEPQAANGYTTIISVDDSEKGGAKPYQFTLRWILQ